MKVLETRDAFLSDYEVLQFLSKLERKHNWIEDTNDENNRKKHKKNHRYNHPELEFITKNTLSYLSIDKNYLPQEEEQEEQDKDALKTSPLNRMNDERFTELVNQLNGFELFKAEKLQIVNQLPTNMVHLYAIVEECDSRFTEFQVEKLLSIIKEYI
ncbi:hypothetical protein Kpol_1060p43 [Vanderwaltozyma polyspora DSM 70294]|uniref:DNA-directed RNA polymerase III subunit RPC9 n=1 Tax=Vanderwaltozyma polyspora (strain ATCC 22028 / DSM 70294 / BCRC 21397 / CBS 2163 / NBRC 10782 / NRRL Y-8283 / UCD 57-17) TaxID=436907 RepID=A7TK41_VANPO|nr:uncharacterized protein Kpol_1060p43 [Vanderwaltozyma polyspora DSM 70294]EDO17387.1 hypothetical protein Kpol_1060p43 [Vanderwaltozyma polyspora DSM 70294]